MKILFDRVNRLWIYLPIIYLAVIFTDTGYDLYMGRPMRSVDWMGFVTGFVLLIQGLVLRPVEVPLPKKDRRHIMVFTCLLAGASIVFLIFLHR